MEGDSSEVSAMAGHLVDWELSATEGDSSEGALSEGRPVAAS